MLNKKFKLLLGATKIAIAEQAYQPNKGLTVALLLSSEDLPGSGWACTGQQDIPTHSFSNGEPEILRAKAMKRTTSRRQFKNSTNAKFVIDEVTPFANTTDAESWVVSADERASRKMSKVVDLNEFRVIEKISLENAGRVRVFQYSTARAESRRTRLVVAANIGSIYSIVTCSDDEQSWPIQDALDVMRAQIEKIRAGQVDHGVVS